MNEDKYPAGDQALDIANLRRKHWAWLNAIVSVLGARSLAAAAAFIGNVLVARQLGDALFSQFYLLFSIMTIVAGLTGPAIDTSLVRFAAKLITPDRDDSPPYFKAVLGLKIIMLGLTVLVALALTRPILRTLFAFNPDDPYHVRYYYVLLAFAGGAVVSMWGFAQSYFQAHQRFKTYVGYEFFSALIRLLFIVLLVGAGTSRVLLFLICYVAAPFIMGCIAWTRLPRKLFTARTSPKVASEILQFGKWVLLATLFTTLTQRMDIILLNVDFFGETKDAVGRYSAALSIVLAGELVLLTTYSVLLPKASALKHAWELRAFIGQFRIPSLILCLLLTLTIPFSGYFVYYVLGTTYYGTHVYYNILILGVIVSIACAPTVTALYSLGYSGMAACLEGTRMVLTLIIGIYTVPRYGVWGMALTAGGIRVFTSIITYFIAHGTVRRAGLAEVYEAEAARDDEE